MDCTTWFQQGNGCFQGVHFCFSVHCSKKAQSTIETDAKKAKSEMGHEGRRHVISLVKDFDIEELRSDIVLQVKAELFLGKTMFVGLV